MPPHSDDKIPSHGPEPEEIDASQGYEQSDIRVTGIVVFLTALAILVVVIGVLSYGIGKVINAELNKEDGPTNKWTKTADVRQLGNLANNPEIQNKMAAITQQFPSPRVQTDDGNQDVADLHLREDLLLDNYTRIDGQVGKVRIPIDRAMELIAQRGLPVAPAVQKAALMTGDQEPAVSVPLTSGFARTAYEQDVDAQRAAEAKRPQE
jgi:Na+-transporting methylmalonyl-CoA/oxaloacetate decarboxylase gamma subunit